MKKILTLMVIAVPVFLTGCILSDDGNGKGADTYTVSGKVLYESGTGIEGVAVTLSGTTSETGNGDIVSVTVASDYRGGYIFKNIRNGSYTVTPVKGGFTFAPGSLQVTVNGMNVSVTSFTGTIKPETSGGGYGEYTVYGGIVDEGGNGMPDIMVGLAGDNLSLTTITDGQGAFSFSGIPNGTYTIAPGKEGFVFSPPYLKIIVRGNDVTIYNFIGSEAGEGGEGGGFAGSHPYYPMSRGAVWTLRAQETDYISGMMKDYQFSRIVKKTKIINTIEYWMLVDDDDKFDSFIRIAGDTVYTFADFAVFSGLGVILDKPGAAVTVSAEPDPNRDELPLIRFDVKPGANYDIMTWSSAEYGASFTLTWLGTYHGDEDVTVPAGTFTGCKKYEIDYYAAGVGGGTTQVEITKTMLWMAQNVGIVKKTVEKSDGYKTILTREEELIGYSIP